MCVVAYASGRAYLRNDSRSIRKGLDTGTAQTQTKTGALLSKRKGRRLVTTQTQTTGVLLPTLEFDFRRRRETTLLSADEHVRGVSVCADGRTMAVTCRAPGADEDTRVRVLAAGAKPSDDDDDDDDDDDPADEDEPGERSGFLDIEERVRLELEPSHEWAAIFDEAGRADALHQDRLPSQRE